MENKKGMGGGDCDTWGMEAGRYWDNGKQLSMSPKRLDCRVTVKVVKLTTVQFHFLRLRSNSNDFFLKTCPQ